MSSWEIRAKGTRSASGSSSNVERVSCNSSSAARTKSRSPSVRSITFESRASAERQDLYASKERRWLLNVQCAHDLMLQGSRNRHAEPSFESLAGRNEARHCLIERIRSELNSNRIEDIDEQLVKLAPEQLDIAGRSLRAKP